MGLPALVESGELLVEAPERSEEVRIHHLHEAVEIVEPVLDRRAGEDEGEAAPEPLHHRGGACPPVLDPLRLVQDEQVRRHLCELALVGAHQLVARDEHRRRLGVGGLPGLARARDHRDVIRAETGELADLAEPLVLQRRWADDQRPPHLAAPRELRHGGDGLGGLAQTHLVGEERPPARGEEGHALDLVRVELHSQSGLVRSCRAHLGFDRAATPLQPLGLDRAPAHSHHLGGNLDARLPRGALELGPDFGEGAAQPAVWPEESRRQAPLHRPCTLREADSDRFAGFEDEMQVARRGALGERPLHAPGRVGAQVMQYRLDVLAGA